MNELSLMVITNDNVQLNISLSFIKFFKCFIFLETLDKESLVKFLNTQSQINISYKALSYIILYCNNKTNSSFPLIERPFLNKTLREIIADDYDFTFLTSIDFDLTCEIIAATEKLQFEYLNDLCLTKIAVMIRDSTIDDLKATLNIKTFTEEDYTNVVIGNKWLMQMNEDRLNELG